LRERIITMLARAIALLLAAFFAFVGWHKLVSPLADLQRYHSWTAYLPELPGRIVGMSELICAAALVLSIVSKYRAAAGVAAAVLIANQLIAAAVHWTHQEIAALPQNGALIALLLAVMLVFKSGRRVSHD
jgi:uncharacterized membrane protein YphA (DoxX/SURF4 family)